MNTSSYSSSAEVLRKPFSYYDSGVFLWIIVGTCLGGALIFTLSITLFIYYRRRKMKQKNANLLNPTYIPGQDLFCPHTMVSSFSSSASDVGSEASGTVAKGAEGRHFRRPLGPSTSLDPPSLLRLTASECHVQPRPSLTRWHTVAAPQTTPVPAQEPGRDSDEEDSPPCLHGRVWFSLLYKNEDSSLQVTLHRARYLPGRGLVNTPRDPFVKVFLLPDEESFKQSKIRKRTLSPKFNETFEFRVEPDDLSSRTLKLSVYDVDKKKVRHSLGHLLLSLKDPDVPTNGETLWKDLEIVAQSTSSPGDLQISLSCNPYSNRIKATVCKARSLQGLPQEAAVTYVKVDLYHGRKVVKTKRTTPQSLSSTSADDVVIDESFSFAVSGRYFDSCSLEFTLVAGVTHGRVVLGPFMYARGEQLRHWQEMLANPRTSVVRWHTLEPPK